ncbi:alpha/beta hydrolase family protein [Mariniflexile sp.]|uniref:alpha/beta hydrolase family protein n=1 Tax=Mariniflexile sp. TaxID=1979402 RepID=UPI004048D64F
MNKKSISNCMAIAFFMLSLFSNYAVAQNKIIQRQDASGGEEVIITSDDIEMHAFMFSPPKGNKPGPAIVLVHGWMPYGTKASWDTNSAKRIASHGATPPWR